MTLYLSSKDTHIQSIFTFLFQIFYERKIIFLLESIKESRALTSFKKDECIKHSRCQVRFSKPIVFLFLQFENFKPKQRKFLELF